MMLLGQRRCVLFDVDGTIAETEGHAHLPAFNRAFEQLGLPWHWSRDDYHGLLKTAGGLERLLRHAEDIGQDPQAMREQLTVEVEADRYHRSGLLRAKKVAALSEPRLHKGRAGGGEVGVLLFASSDLLVGLSAVGDLWTAR